MPRAPQALALAAVLLPTPQPRNAGAQAHQQPKKPQDGASGPLLHKLSLGAWAPEPLSNKTAAVSLRLNTSHHTGSPKNHTYDHHTNATHSINRETQPINTTLIIHHTHLPLRPCADGVPNAINDRGRRHHSSRAISYIKSSKAFVDASSNSSSS